MSAEASLAAAAAALESVVSRLHLPVIVTQSEDGRMLTAGPEAGRSPAPAGSDVKNSPRAAPPGHSFELSVLLRPLADRAADQRLVLPTQAATSLGLEGDASTGMWTLPAGVGEELVVHLTRGGSMTSREVEDVLQAIEPALLSLGSGGSR
ncbi:MAG TPA: hypothetical protein VNX29_04035 [Kaistia sp.]|nr:hypothetical protein [Kaistia sp.]